MTASSRSLTLEALSASWREVFVYAALEDWLKAELDSPHASWLTHQVMVNRTIWGRLLEALGCSSYFEPDRQDSRVVVSEWIPTEAQDAEGKTVPAGIWIRRRTEIEPAWPPGPDGPPWGLEAARVLLEPFLEKTTPGDPREGGQERPQGAIDDPRD